TLTAVGYLMTTGPTTFVMVAAVAASAGDADTMATKGADAEKALMGGSSAPPTPAPAPTKKPVPTPQPSGHTPDEAKSWSIGLDGSTPSAASGSPASGAPQTRPATCTSTRSTTRWSWSA